MSITIFVLDFSEGQRKQIAIENAGFHNGANFPHPDVKQTHIFQIKFAYSPKVFVGSAVLRYLHLSDTFQY